mmetsp:Transcript_23656/g.76935  ORF Transcript_23656/g.76935 Transcript_23656/m.76935 type:complete len:231 (+) Transcript_23656:1326-2018(+)
MWSSRRRCDVSSTLALPARCSLSTYAICSCACASELSERSAQAARARAGPSGARRRDCAARSALRASAFWCSLRRAPARVMKVGGSTPSTTARAMKSEQTFAASGTSSTRSSSDSVRREKPFAACAGSSTPASSTTGRRLTASSRSRALRSIALASRAFTKKCPNLLPGLSISPSERAASSESPTVKYSCIKAAQRPLYATTASVAGKPPLAPPPRPPPLSRGFTSSLLS